MCPFHIVHDQEQIMCAFLILQMTKKKTDHVCPLYAEDDQEQILCVLFIDAKVPSSHKLNSIHIETDAEIVFCFIK